MLSPWLLERLACPRCHQPVTLDATWLTCQQNHRYPVVDGIPIMLLDDVRQTHWAATHSLEHYASPESELPPLKPGEIDPFVMEAVGATCGNLYKNIIGQLPRYPIPTLRFDATPGTPFLDIGCHWGRWCVAAARKGFRVVGVDPFLKAVRAAKRVAAGLEVDADFVVADGRHLPFSDRSFGMVHSYSVLQHFSEEDVRAATREIGRVLLPGGECHVQMAQAIGLLNLVQQARRGFRPARDFEVRYWSLAELRTTFSESVGPTDLTVDGFFSLGAQASDLDMLPPLSRIIVRTSDALRRLTDVLPPLIRVADSVYVNARRGDART